MQMWTVVKNGVLGRTVGAATQSDADSQLGDGESLIEGRFPSDQFYWTGTLALPLTDLSLVISPPAQNGVVVLDEGIALVITGLPQGADVTCADLTVQTTGTTATLTGEIDGDWDTVTIAAEGYKPRYIGIRQRLSADMVRLRLAEVDRERARRSILPIEYIGAPFDANALARERISGTLARLLRGDGLTTGWVGWRDHANAMHWTQNDAATVQGQLAGLSRAIEDREQALLIAAWTHKYQLAQLTTVEQIMAYDVAVGW